MSAARNLFLSLKKRGLGGTISLVIDKRRKHSRIAKLLIAPSQLAALASYPTPNTAHQMSSQDELMEKANAMLEDDNYFFTFPYRTKGVADPWNYDPFDNTYWPKQQYEETTVHAVGRPRDVKIVWEINRFKDLPALGVAAYTTQDARYADEVKRRLHSWIMDNPFGKTINWSSPLEIAIRGISWAVTLRLLHLAGFRTVDDESIKRSLWQHVTYLNASLSIDKIVRSNHLIGETAGLYVLSSLLEFPEARAFRDRAKRIHIEAVLEQTFADGVSKEASGWYHGFVTDFAELLSRVAHSNGDTLSDAFTNRLRQMIIYRNSIFATDGGIVKYGDFDNGRALALPNEWQDIVLGASPQATKDRSNIFEQGQHITAKIDRNYCFARAGEFGWGGDGFASHAHDDLLAPVVYLDGNPILADAGTYVYNGDHESRNKFRDSRQHNTVILSGATGAKMKPSFGWLIGRKAAKIESHQQSDDQFTAVCTYGEWSSIHERTFTIDRDSFVIHDDLTYTGEAEWHFHFHPRWRLTKVSEHAYDIRDYRDHRYRFELSSANGEFELANYEYSASYMEKSKAQKLTLRKRLASTVNERYTFAITRTS